MAARPRRRRPGAVGLPARRAGPRPRPARRPGGRAPLGRGPAPTGPAPAGRPGRRARRRGVGRGPQRPAAGRRRAGASRRWRWAPSTAAASRRAMIGARAALALVHRERDELDRAMEVLAPYLDDALREGHVAITTVGRGRAGPGRVRPGPGRTPRSGACSGCAATGPARGTPPFLGARARPGRVPGAAAARRPRPGPGPARRPRCRARSGRCWRPAVALVRRPARRRWRRCSPPAGRGRQPPPPVRGGGAGGPGRGRPTATWRAPAGCWGRWPGGPAGGGPCAAFLDEGFDIVDAGGAAPGGCRAAPSRGLRGAGGPAERAGAVGAALPARAGCRTARSATSCTSRSTP